MPKPLVKLDNIGIEFAGKNTLEQINLELYANETLTLVGPNGAGKTTLVKILLGLLEPSSGSITRQAKLRIGYMPQKLAVHPTMPLTVERFLRLVPNTRKSEIQQALAEVGAEKVLHSPIQRISGGELQRVLLARALLRKPQLLVLDEPVQGVDVNGQLELYKLIADLRKRYQCGVFMVSHDLHLVMGSTDRVICLNRHICCSGHPEQVSEDPAFIELFGRKAASNLAVYHHDHDHAHDLHGCVVTPHTSYHQHGPDCTHG
ncbi:zinc ABC transporter ATP-binding protein [Thiopseudomonas alkaliphila]|uniref:zinc ABC transporter ATP-binding protein ZnuC n=1 Tax=Thiopseudomonas alkaliphila TaxID=1697053 RepID=UPI00069DC3D8|nr:zinc ABC transporter ATP-binding protein ZnuC [Thiopseudomonas alkaliphila]AKX47120.1 zinc ABC transporter ATP-binding protein [Thiopseudomonas alkaliphila]AKX47127.1 zinc ABC transporter ATP-binding protein [Thiopseudomonas alkaliphila]